MEINLDQIKKIHVIGIGGIGISAMAKLMQIRGKIVSGSDMSESPITQKLKDANIDIKIGHSAEYITSDIDLIIYTIAIPDNNPEIIEAKNKKIPMMTYPQMLSIISKDMYTIAVSGTHGKTTTTAMLSKIMIDANLDPTIIVGSIMKDRQNNQISNLVVGGSKYFLVEACEYRRSFLNLYPTILIITNIEEDHLDYYRNLEDIQSAFREIALRIPEYGAIICDKSDPHIQSIIKDLSCNIIDYKIYKDKKFRLQIPGEHNRQNASAGLSVSNFLHIDEKTAIQSLENFTGTWRRFDFKGKTKNGAIVYDDYAHHPQEIQATLSGTKEMFPNKKIIVFFQPHLFSRTKLLLKEFSESFNDVDEVYILPIYPAREIFDPSISSEMIVDKINTKNNKAQFIENFDQAKEKMKLYNSEYILITMGAGDVYKIADEIVV